MSNKPPKDADLSIAAQPEPANDRSHHVRVTHSDGREEIFSVEKQQEYEAEVAKTLAAMERIPFFRQWGKWETLSEAEVEHDVERQLRDAGISDSAAEAARMCAEARQSEAKQRARSLKGQLMADWLLDLAIALQDRIEQARSA